MKSWANIKYNATFWDWLVKRQLYREDPVGDLARDALRVGKEEANPSWLTQSPEAGLPFGACHGAVLAARQAVREYKKAKANLFVL
jgi:hypothetical protein